MFSRVNCSYEIQIITETAPPQIHASWLTCVFKRDCVDFKQVHTLMQLIVQYHNGSRLWCTCGWKPDELAAKFSGIGAFPGQEASSPEGMMDEKDIIRKMKELGLKVLE